MTTWTLRDRNDGNEFCNIRGHLSLSFFFLLLAMRGVDLGNEYQAVSPNRHFQPSLRLRLNRFPRFMITYS